MKHFIPQTPDFSPNLHNKKGSNSQIEALNLQEQLFVAAFTT